ncbi:hypothetical protein DdX_09241 [Ditylenchus destructor]|uniref:Uncharacterized protein n=1 Tax=Ditylenchus destructor TaxID=166010 RepID=A0AAD4N1D7_9BILA|nr:hypothetical protein DdX_09241 [Ditylenchus destructor]
MTCPYFCNSAQNSAAENECISEQDIASKPFKEVCRKFRECCVDHCSKHERNPNPYVDCHKTSKDMVGKCDCYQNSIKRPACHMISWIASAFISVIVIVFLI